MAESFVDITYSRDGGRNQSNVKRRSLGETGDFLKTVTVNRCGQSEQFVFTVRVTDPVKADLVACSVKVETER